MYIFTFIICINNVKKPFLIQTRWEIDNLIVKYSTPFFYVLTVVYVKIHKTSVIPYINYF